MMETRTYHSIALDDRFPGGRKSGELSVAWGKICFKHSDGEWTWPLNETEFSRGGAGNSLIYVKNSRHPETVLYTTDKKLLSDKELQGHYGVRQSVSAIKKQHRIRWAVALVVVALLLSPFVMLFMFRDGIVRKIADKLPVSYEQKIGDQLFGLVSSGYTIIEDSTLNQQFNQMVAPLVKEVEDTAHHFSFYIINDTTVNAFALPGGKVVVNSGLILKSDRWSEVQGVLAHEIAHVTLRHHVRGVINNQGFFFVVSALLGGYSDVVATLAGYGSHLESLMYSRKFEFEADNRACEYLNKAGIDATGMVSFFEKLQQAHPDNKTSGFTQILSTHPATADRIANLKSKVAQPTAAKYIDPGIDIKEFQQQLKKHL